MSFELGEDRSFKLWLYNPLWLQTNSLRNTFDSIASRFALSVCTPLSRLHVWQWWYHCLFSTSVYSDFLTTVTIFSNIFRNIFWVDQYTLNNNTVLSTCSVFVTSRLLVLEMIFVKLPTITRKLS